jgi:two-component system sensor histidine kinase UhpB
MGAIRIDTDILLALQRRAEAMAQGDLSLLGQPVSAIPQIEDLRRAIDVLGAHTEHGLRGQHAYIAALSTAQEAERARIARELHDEIVQQLIALGHSIDRVQRFLQSDPDQATERLQRMRSSVTALVEELRAMIGDLRPPALAELGLLPAVELLLERPSEEGPHVTITVQGNERRLAPQSELAVFRIVQEAWNNIRRHAAATRSDFAFVYTTDGLDVTITDDGVGFALPADMDAPDQHWGIRGMRERAELTGGALEISSAPGRGTQLQLHIPYPGEDGRDPVCGMPVEPDAIGAEYNGKLYRFCSPSCRDLFVAHPAQYVAPSLDSS